MKTTELDNDLHITGQITPNDIRSAAKKGIKTIINVRPDGEREGDYMTAQEASEIANENGVNFCHIPVVPDQISDQNVADFRKVMAELPGPILAYCGSGKRVSVLWALSNSGSLSADERIEKAAEAGHDLSALKPRLG